MKAAISTDNGFVSQHFGRCPQFTLVTIEAGKVIEKKIISNPGHQPGFLPQFLHEQGVDTIIAGGMGPRAEALFQEVKIRPLLGVSGAVDTVIDQLCRDTLQAGESTCVPGEGRDYGLEKSVCDNTDAQGEEHFHVQGKVKGKVCVSSQGETLDSQVDPRFGRCAWFIIYDFDTGKAEALINANVSSPSGAGISSAQQIINSGAVTVITGNVGPNAFGVLNSAGIKVMTGAQGITVKEALKKFSGDEFKPTQGPSVNGHFGM